MKPDNSRLSRYFLNETHEEGEMRLFIDCEWNSYKGELISLALVSEHNHEFYEVLEIDQEYHPWVAEHVVPKLNKAPVSRQVFQQYLEEFLNQFQKVTVIADWPEDIAHFCMAVIKNPLGERIDLPQISFKFVPLGDELSDNPHNALDDAKAIMRQYFHLLAKG